MASVGEREGGLDELTGGVLGDPKGTLMASGVEERGSPVEGFGCAGRHHGGHGLELRGV